MVDLSALGATSRGIWTRKQAATLLSRGRIDGFVRRGEWQSPWPGVYADAGIELDPEQRGFAAVLASGGEEQRAAAGRRLPVRAVASGRLAARLHGFPLVDDDDPATGRCEHLLDDVSVTWDGPALTASLPDGRIRTLARHRRRFRSDEVVRLPSGLLVTSYAQTIVDSAQLLHLDALVCVLDFVLHRSLMTAADLESLVQQRAWMPGVRDLRSAVQLADGRAESPHETLTRLVLKPHLPGLVPQHRLRDDWGRILARFDLGDEEIRLAVEADGKRGHAGRAMAARDHRRDRISDARGWRTERVVWFETRCRQEELVRRMLQAADDQARRHGLS